MKDDCATYLADHTFAKKEKKKEVWKKEQTVTLIEKFTTCEHVVDGVDIDDDILGTVRLAELLAEIKEGIVVWWNVYGLVAGLRVEALTQRQLAVGDERHGWALPHAVT